jgi:hypothetical protein
MDAAEYKRGVLGLIFCYSQVKEQEHVCTSHNWNEWNNACSYDNSNCPGVYDPTNVP